MAARMAGVMAATGKVMTSCAHLLVSTHRIFFGNICAKVLTFLDSHIEATEGWLEPLLERVHQNPKAIACPVIEEVNDRTFQYKFVTRDLVGVFFWNLDFGWTAVKRPDWSPYDTPVMAGGLFSIRFVPSRRKPTLLTLCHCQEGLVRRVRVL